MSDIEGLRILSFDAFAGCKTGGNRRCAGALIQNLKDVEAGTTSMPLICRGTAAVRRSPELHARLACSSPIAIGALEYRSPCKPPVTGTERRDIFHSTVPPATTCRFLYQRYGLTSAFCCSPRNSPVECRRSRDRAGTSFHERTGTRLSYRCISRTCLSDPALAGRGRCLTIRPR